MTNTDLGARELPAATPDLGKATVGDAARPAPDRPGGGIIARALTIGYRTGPVVHEAGVTVEPGTVTALVGPNGSGKSTLLRAMARLHPTIAGELALTGERPGATRSATALSRREFSRHVALLTQQRPTPDGVTVVDLVTYGRNPHQGRFRRQDPDGRAVVDRSMRATGIADLADRRVDELSGGQLQRVWLAACLAQDTGVLLLDEPTNHLDLRYQAEMLDLIAELADANIALGVVLHDLNHAAEIADRVVLLHHGRVFADGDPADVLTAEILSEVYEVPIAVHTDPITGVLTTRPLSGRPQSRRRPATTTR